MTTESPNRGPTWAVVVAACLPLGACPVAPALFAAEAGGAEGLARRVNEGGYFVFLVGLALIIGVAVASVCLGLLARGVRIPTAVPLFFAVLPWLVGDAGLRHNVNEILAAIVHVSPGDKAIIVAAGFSEASIDRHVVALFSSVLLGFVGVGLSIAALGRSRVPSLAGALAGALAALPVLAAALLSRSPLTVLPAAAALVGLVIAARSASADVPHARSAALAAACGAPFGLAVVGGAVAAVVSQVAHAATVLASVAPADRVSIAIAAAAELKTFSVLATWGWALAAVPVLAVGGWALMRGSSVRAPVAELAASALLVALVAAADLSAARAVNDAAAALEIEPWRAEPGFKPMQLAGTPLRAGFDGALSRDSAAWHLASGPDIELVVALDARAGEDRLAELLSTAREKYARTLVLVGEPVRARAPEPSSPYDASAWLVRLLQGPVSVEVLLEPPNDGRQAVLLSATGLKPQALAEQAFAARLSGKVLQLKRPETEAR